TMLALTLLQSGGPHWDTVRLEPMGWTGRRGNDQALLFTRPAVGGVPSLKRIWARYENHPDSDPARRHGSTVQLWDVDCSQMRGKLRAQTLYSGNNLGGESHASDPAEEPQWAFSTPGSLQETLFETACAAR
ncbi:MAG TPA: surface-adhesin E family protein, partial [Caulobacteraceae bacterium]